MKKFLAISSALALAGTALTGCGAGMAHEGEYTTEDGRVTEDKAYSRVTELPGDGSHTAEEHIRDAVDGAADAGKDIAGGAAEAASDLVDGLDGHIEHRTATGR